VNDELLDFESDKETNDQVKPLNWAQYDFIKPLRIIMQLSGCPSFTCLSLYKILVSLATTSCSAERAMSRVRIIKIVSVQLCYDDWFSAFMVLSAEKDLQVAPNPATIG